MNPIRIIPFKYTNQPKCPQCFGEIEPYQLSQKRNDLFRCKECGQLYCHPDNIEEESEDVIYLTVRAYFKYNHLKNCIINASYNIKTKRIDKKVRCNVDGKIYETSADVSALHDFFEQNDLQKLKNLNTDGYSVTSSREVINITLSCGGRERNFKGNLDLLEIIPRMDILLSIIFFVCQDVLRKVLDKHVFKLM